VRIRHIIRSTRVEAASLEDAYQKGYFSNNMRRDEFMARCTKYEPELRWYATPTHRGLWHSKNGFICGITHAMTMPDVSIFKYDPKYDRTLTDLHGAKHKVHEDEVDEGTQLARGWRATLNIVRHRGYRIDDRGINIY